MIINPKIVLDQHLGGTGASIAQNGIDIAISRIYRLNRQGRSVIKGKERTFTDRTLLVPQNGEYTLQPGNFYEWSSDVDVQVPMDMAGLVVARSSMLRAGVFVTSGVWDSGFRGKISGFAHCVATPVTIGEHERVGQFLMFSAEAYQAYNGIYQGTGSTVDVKPNKPTVEYQKEPWI